jgi:NADH:ubiquinone oxidoreductase subunit E
MTKPEINLSRADEIIGSHQNNHWPLIPLLQELQEEFGFIPPETIFPVAKALKIAPSVVQGVVEFYSGFSLTPKGKHVFKVCCGTACHVKGSRNILNTIKKELHINEGETSDDYQYSLETVACMGACFLAPAMMADKNYYGKLSPGKISSIVEQYTQKKKGTEEE